MKANELQLGDLVQVAKDVCIKKDTIVKVRNIDGDNSFLKKGLKLKGCATCEPIDDRILSGGVWVEYLAPIPLTAEILEKNFPNTDSGLGWFPDGDGFHCDSSYSEGDILVSGFFRYVHTLQHALRLCGIEKEIVL